MGHVIDRDGIHFTRDKLDSVTNFPLPKTKGELKAFIGLVNYFRDHLKDLSIVLRPLDKLVTPYHPKDILTWDVPCTEAFEIAKQLVDECPKLFLFSYRLNLIKEKRYLKQKN